MLKVPPGAQWIQETTGQNSRTKLLNSDRCCNPWVVRLPPTAQMRKHWPRRSWHLPSFEISLSQDIQDTRLKASDSNWMGTIQSTGLFIVSIKPSLVGGIPTPLKNMSSSVGMTTFPTEWKNKSHVPNHQPDPSCIDNLRYVALVGIQFDVSPGRDQSNVMCQEFSGYGRIFGIVYAPAQVTENLSNIRTSL